MCGKNPIYMAVTLLDFFRHMRFAHHAAADKNSLAGMAALGMHQRAEIAQHPLLGMFAHRAGIDDNQVCTLFRIRSESASFCWQP